MLLLQIQLECALEVVLPAVASVDAVVVGNPGRSQVRANVVSGHALMNPSLVRRVQGTENLNRQAVVRALPE